MLCPSLSPTADLSPDNSTKRKNLDPLGLERLSKSSRSDRNWILWEKSSKTGDGHTGAAWHSRYDKTEVSAPP